MHPYNGGTEHTGFSTDQAILAHHQAMGVCVCVLTVLMSIGRPSRILLVCLFVLVGERDRSVLLGRPSHFCRRRRRGAECSPALQKGRSLDTLERSIVRLPASHGVRVKLQSRVLACIATESLTDGARAWSFLTRAGERMLPWRQCTLVGVRVQEPSNQKHQLRYTHSHHPFWVHSVVRSNTQPKQRVWGRHSNAPPPLPLPASPSPLPSITYMFALPRRSIPRLWAINSAARLCFGSIASRAPIPSESYRETCSARSCTSTARR